MGYFSNGTEGMSYEEQYCMRCLHGPNRTDGKWCTVWEAHQLHSYEECNNKESILHILIPRNENGDNEACTMFLEDPHWNQENLPL
jgi:hypothetical protein